MNATRRFLTAGVSVAVAVGAVGLLSLNGQESSSTHSQPTQAVLQLHADHATYAGLNNLVGAAPVVFSGMVTGSSAGAAIPGPSGDPAGADAIPQTDYAVAVTRTYKGTVPAAGRATVNQTGGSTSDGGVVELEGVPALSNGAEYVFFVLPGGDGKYYPLAGGAAVASRAADGSFVLPSEAGDGGIQISFTTTQLATVPAADHVLVMLMNQPQVRIDGIVQSGSAVVVTSNGSPTGLSGTALVAGRIVTLAITITDRRATGSFSIDDVSYTLQSGVVTPGRDRSVAIEGRAQSPNGVQQVRLQVFDR